MARALSLARRAALALLALVAATACRGETKPLSPLVGTTTTATPDAPSSSDAIVIAHHCPPGAMTYLGFRGEGAPPPALWKAIRAVFPKAILVEASDGNLGVLIEEPHDWNVRKRHESAAASVGWKGDVVDFPSVDADCKMSFHTPPPP